MGKRGERESKKTRRTICPVVDGVAEVSRQACVCVPPPDLEGVVEVDHEDVGDAAGTPGIASDPGSTVLVLPRALRNPIILEPPQSILVSSRWSVYKRTSPWSQPSCSKVVLLLAYQRRIPT